jgi:poly-gamma-glutamate capsule biosynthesis protein CapA/YwtB (metallophosphatase superfamily)
MGITLYAVGDVAPNRDNLHSMFQYVRDFLRQGDMGFCQLEANLSLRGTPLPQARLPMRAHPDNAEAIKDAGFHVVSFAGNHCLDWGQDALFDTIDVIKEQGMHIIGVGANIEEARRPAIIKKRDTRIAFLAYNSVLPIGYWAEEDRPGCTPMRAWTVYEPIEHDQPGTPCRIHTFPNKHDLQAMVDDIQKVRAEADVVVISMHWGIHFVPAQIADYQREIAHAAIDCGADLILGHHPHILKGIEVYKGKVAMYSLGNFAIEQPSAFMADLYNSRRHKEIEALNPEWDSRDDYPLPPETRNSFVAKCIISDGNIMRVSFLPVYLTTRSEPEILKTTDERFKDVVQYIQEITNNQGLETVFVLEGEEVVIKTG